MITNMPIGFQAGGSSRTSSEDTISGAGSVGEIYSFRNWCTGAVVVALKIHKLKGRCRPTIYRELDELTDRERVMARLARNIGRGRDVIYHGTRSLPDVMRAGKLIPPDSAECAVFFSRSPEVAAYFACLMGKKEDRHSPGILILDRSSMRQRYRLEPSRYDLSDGRDEREEAVWGRSVSFRRHLLGVVSEANVSAVIGPPKQPYLPQGFVRWPAARQRKFNERQLASGRKFVAEGRAAVRDLIVRERFADGENQNIGSFSRRGTCGLGERARPA